MELGRVAIWVGQLSDTKKRIWLSVVLGGVLFGLFIFCFDRLMHYLGVPEDVHAGMEGVLSGLGVGFGLWLFLTGLRERRHRIADELRRVAELNHTIRNSLHIIALAQHTAEQSSRDVVLESTNRIDQKLKELFPVVGFEKSGK
jgi:hypothetical protein